MGCAVQHVLSACVSPHGVFRIDGIIQDSHRLAGRLDGGQCLVLGFKLVHEAGHLSLLVLLLLPLQLLESLQQKFSGTKATQGMTTGPTVKGRASG